MFIGEKIKAKRIELKWSQRELADKMGYSNHSTITRIEAGKVDIPQSRVFQFATVLGVDVTYLMGQEPDTPETAEAEVLYKKIMNDKELQKMIKTYFGLSNYNQEKVRSIIQKLK